MVCGAALRYLAAEREQRCGYCGAALRSDACCEQGHFVCDACHSRDGLQVIEQICRLSAETDMVALMDHIRGHGAIPDHGPEHHALVPAVIVTTYRNLGGTVDEQALATAIARGSKVPGGFCGQSGGCGAALGVGIGFSILLGASPVKAELRQQVQQITAKTLLALASQPAARCCQRDGWTALQEAAELSKSLLPIPLRAEAPLTCTQHQRNRFCLGESCAIHPAFPEEG